MDSVRPIYKYLLQQNNQVVELITRSKIIHSIEKSIKPIINQYVKNGWRLGNFSQHELTIVVNTPESALSLRYQTTKILEAIRTLEFCELLNNINIKVIPKGCGEQHQISHAGKLSGSLPGRKCVSLLAESVQDAPLKASLQRLARHLSPENKN